MNHVDNPFKSPAILSLCTGMRGLERGLERAIGPIRVAAYVEREAFIIANLVAGMEAGVLDPAPIWTDVKTFNAQPFRGRIHGIIGGYPCPGESLAGLQEGHRYKGFIWPSIRKTIATARPLWCFFENVDDHLTGTYPIVQRSLRNMGYAVEAGVFSVSEVGGSIEAQRLFILAVETSVLQRLRKYNVCELLNESFGASQTMGQTVSSRFSNGNEIQPVTGSELQKSIDRSEKMGEAANQQFPISKGKQRQTGGFKERCADIGGPSEAVGQAHSLRSFGRDWNDGRKTKRKNGAQARSEIIRTSAADFPLGQGYLQWDWEEPRQIESCVGYTIERYNFTEDLLRANGNMVPEQQTELAFRTLIQKFL